jgi:hypothetical protein
MLFAVDRELPVWCHFNDLHEDKQVQEMVGPDAINEDASLGRIKSFPD